jgi:hypothetical protein
MLIYTQRFRVMRSLNLVMMQQVAWIDIGTSLHTHMKIILLVNTAMLI